MRYLWLVFLTTLSLCCQATEFTIQVKQPRQTIRHFGASDAWSMRFIGLWQNEVEQLKIADWLFSTANDAQGKPRGIGLSVWRFNLGAGSEEQGRESQINPGTRTECFLTKDGFNYHENGHLCSGSNAMNDMMRRAHNIVGLTREEVGSLYSESPAKCLKITDRGKIEVGRKSDFVIMDPDYNVETTIIDGKVFYQKD